MRYPPRALRALPQYAHRIELDFLIWVRKEKLNKKTLYVQKLQPQQLSNLLMLRVAQS